MFCRNKQRNAALAAQLDEMRGLLRAFGKQNAVVAENADRHAVDAGKAGDDRGAVELLELVEFGSVDKARDHLAHVVLLLQIDRHDAVEFGRAQRRLARRMKRNVHRFPVIEIGDDAARERQRVVVVLRQMIGDAGLARMQIAAAEILGAHHLAGRRLHQRRAAKENGALVLDDDGLVRHRRHIGAAGGAGAHHHGDLRNARRRQIGLVVEDAAEMLAVGKHLGLRRQIGAAGIDQIDAGQPVLARNFLGAQMFFDRHRMIAAALDGGVVGHDHAFAPLDAAYAGDDAGGVHVAAIHAEGGERRQFQKRRAGVDQVHHAFPRQQLAARDMALARFFRTAQRGLGAARLQFGDERAHFFRIAAKLGAAGIDGGRQNRQRPLPS